MIASYPQVKCTAKCFENPLTNTNSTILKTNLSNGECGGLVVRDSDSGARGRGFDPHSGRRVVSLNKTQFIPQKYR